MTLIMSGISPIPVLLQSLNLHNELSFAFALMIGTRRSGPSILTGSLRVICKHLLPFRFFSIRSCYSTVVDVVQAVLFPDWSWPASAFFLLGRFAFRSPLPFYTDPTKQRSFGPKTFQ